MHIGLNAHLLSGAAGYRSAGIHSYLSHLIAELPAQLPSDWRLTVMVGAQQAAEFAGVAMRRARLNTESAARRIVWEQAAQPFAVLDFDLLHAAAFVAPALVTRPMVTTIYDLSFVHYPERLPASRWLYLQSMARLTCRRARRVIAISEATARDLTETWDIDPERIDVAAPGVDRNVFRPLDSDAIASFRAHNGLPEHFWLFIGTLEPRKNLTTLIDAYARVPTDIRQPLIIGGGKGWDYEPIFAAVEQHGLTDSVRFTGYITGDDLPLWYNSADIFLYPSLFEGFGLPVLEAMSCGTPVVVSNASSLVEIARGAGLLIPPRDVEAWAAALAQAGTDSAWRAEASARGLQRAEAYTWADTAAQTLNSYRRALQLS